MTRNMGKLDRMVRGILVAPLALGAAWIAGATSLVGLALIAFAGVMLATAIAGFCPLYALFGINTARRTV